MFKPLSLLPALGLTLLPCMGAAQALEFASQREGVSIRAMTTLPANPAATGDDCGSAIAPETAGGKAAAAGNWIVTHEITQSDLTYVSFVGKTTAGTSGSCLMEGGNLGIFRGPDLLGLAYGDQGAPRQIGSAQALEPEGVRLWDGDYGSAPLADLHLIAGQLILIRPLADRDPFCGGKFTLPSLYGLPIHQARIPLIAEGWQPAPPAEASPSGYVQDMAKSLPELTDCSGTGFGYCGYAYTGKDGTTLSVVTAGEAPEGTTPRVVDYNIECD